MGKLSSRTEFVKPTFQSSVNLYVYINKCSGTPNFAPPENLIQDLKESIDRWHHSNTSWSGLNTLKKPFQRNYLRKTIILQTAAEIYVRRPTCNFCNIYQF